MYEPVGGLDGMASGAIAECAWVALQLVELDCVVRFPAGCDSMRAIMTTLAIDSSMAGGLTV